MSTEAWLLGLSDADKWLASNLHFDRPTVTWRRRDLRELGFGEQIDAHIAAGRCTPDKKR